MQLTLRPRLDLVVPARMGICWEPDGGGYALRRGERCERRQCLGRGAPLLCNSDGDGARAELILLERPLAVREDGPSGRESRLCGVCRERHLPAAGEHARVGQTLESCFRSAARRKSCRREVWGASNRILSFGCPTWQVLFGRAANTRSHSPNITRSRSKSAFASPSPSNG